MISPKRSVSTLHLHRLEGGTAVRRKDAVAVEEPLEIRVARTARDGPQSVTVSVTMRTPGADFELAAGFLFGEGFVEGRSSILEITYCSGDEPQEYNVVQVLLAPEAGFEVERLRRNVYTTSSCGVCGKASLEALERAGLEPLADEAPEVDPEVITRLPDALRKAQPAFERTGGLHAAGLFTAEGGLRLVREDVGRHNAVDKVVGHELLEGRVPLSGHLLAVSGRASFEIVQKAVAAGIPVVVAVGAPSSLAVELARRFHLTLVGFAREGGCNVYTGAHRIRGLAGAR